MPREASSPIPVAPAMDEREPSADPIFIVVAVTLVFALVAFGLGRAAGQLPARIPQVAKVAACASIMPLAFTAIGYAFYVDGGFSEWISSREPRAYRDMAILCGVGLAAAWFALRRQNDSVDPATFD